MSNSWGAGEPQVSLSSSCLTVLDWNQKKIFKLLFSPPEITTGGESTPRGGSMFTCHRKGDIVPLKVRSLRTLLHNSVSVMFIKSNLICFGFFWVFLNETYTHSSSSSVSSVRSEHGSCLPHNRLVSSPSLAESRDLHTCVTKHVLLSYKLKTQNRLLYNHSGHNRSVYLFPFLCSIM